jgi:phospholipid transport system transporter-binding protein
VRRAQANITVAEIIKTDGKWRVKGDLLLDDIESLLEQNFEFDGVKLLEVDMSDVSEVDSVTISLLFEWLRQAKSNKCALFYSNLPTNLASLATLYGVLDLIPQAAHKAASH